MWEASWVWEGFSEVRVVRREMGGVNWEEGRVRWEMGGMWREVGGVRTEED